MPAHGSGSPNATRWWSFERRRGETLRRALERTLREAILSGALREGVRLPASRILADDLGVSRGVVTDAYDQLASQGFLIKRHRAAPVVAAVPRRRPVVAPVRETSTRVRYDLTATTPDVTLFPLRRWLTTSMRAAQGAPSAVLDYRDSGGERSLRETLADHLGRTRGVVAEPEQIIVVQGTSQAVDLLLRTLRRRGARRIAVEDPSHTGQQMRVMGSGLGLVGQIVDEHGLVVDGLGADAVLVTPAHQFPTGVVLTPDRRRSLLEWARATGALVIEDDYDAEFRYDREPVRAVQGLAPDGVVQLGTVSKTLAPALRLGWIVAPPTLVDELTRQKALVDESSPPLDQIGLAAFLRNGEYDRHVRRAKAVYRGRRDRLVQALADQLPDLPVVGIAAGVHVLLSLPSWADDTAIAQAAEEEQIRVSPLSQFCIRRTDLKGLVVGYARIHESVIASAVSTLASVVRCHLDGDGHRRRVIAGG